MHVQPVRFDVEVIVFFYSFSTRSLIRIQSIRHLAAYFGPVQTIEPYKGLGTFSCLHSNSRSILLQPAMMAPYNL